MLWEQAGVEVGKRVCVDASLPRDRKELALDSEAGPPPLTETVVIHGVYSSQ